MLFTFYSILICVLRPYLAFRALEHMVSNTASDANLPQIHVHVIFLWQINKGVICEHLR